MKTDSSSPTEQQDAPTGSRWSRLRRSVCERLAQPRTRQIGREVLLPFVLQRSLLFLAVGFGAGLVPSSRGWHAMPRNPLFDGWLRFDSQYYLMLAATGYGPGHRGKMDSFFPFYPWLVRAVALVLPLAYAALLVANVAALVALLLIYLLAQRWGDSPLARRSVWVTLLFPSSFFLSAAYAESTFLTGSVGAYLAWEAGLPLWGALGAAVAAMSRPVGLFTMSVPFGLDWLLNSRSWRWRSLPWPVIGALVGANLVLLIYYHAFGNSLAFLQGEGVRSLGLFHQVYAPQSSYWDVLLDEGVSANLMRRLLNWSAFALVMGGAVVLLRRRQVAAGMICVIAMVVPLYFHDSLFDAASLARYALGAFPVLILLARWAPDGLRARGLDLGSQMLQVILAVLFSCWRWAE